MSYGESRRAVSEGRRRRGRMRCPVCGRDVALTAVRQVVGPHNDRRNGGSRCAGAGWSADGGGSAWPPLSSAGGDLVRLADAAAARNVRRRVALVERLAELEVQADAVAKDAIWLVTDGVPAVVEAMKLALATPRPEDADDVLLEQLVRADPQRARRILDSITDPAPGSVADPGG
jgi:hypothetical protein